jgi:hypothetical protein
MSPANSKRSKLATVVGKLDSLKQKNKLSSQVANSAHMLGYVLLWTVL